ncbi:MAG: autotransporter-associated beta strand repeat-containing protein [Kiritimatiellia bacterium]
MIHTFYVDGACCGRLGQSSDIKLQADKPLALGGVLRAGTMATYTNFFAGALSRVRVHTGPLSEDDVRHNYLADVPSYRAGELRGLERRRRRLERFLLSGRTAGSARASTRCASRGGSLTVTNDDVIGQQSGDVGSAYWNDRVDHLRRAYRQPHAFPRGPRKRSGGRDQRVERRAPRCVERQSCAYLDLGVNGALSTLEVGGSGTAATLYTAQLRAFAEGTSDIRVMKGGVIEMDALFADALSVPSVSVAGGTFRNRTGGTMGYFFNVPQVNVSTDGVTFDTPAGAVMAVSAPLLHDASGPDAGGGLRKIGGGTLVLSGTNTYAGATSVEAGTLVLAPRLLDGLVYRLDTSADALDTLTLDASSNVLAWADCSGAGFVFTTNKTTICPVYDPALFGGRGGLRFSRDATCCRLATDRAAKIQTVFAVVAPAAGNDIGGLWGLSGDDYGIRFNATSVQYTGNNNDFSASGAVYTNGAFGNGFTVGQPFVLTAVADRPQTWVTAIGDYWGNLEHRRAYRGDIAEILTYDRRLDDRERQEIAQYLMAKWLGTVSAPALSDQLLPHANALTVGAGASVDLHGSSATLSMLQGAGVIGNGQPATSLLTIGADDAEFAFAGSITGNVAVSKIGAGNAVFAGQNTLSGPLTIEAGTLSLAPASRRSRAWSTGWTPRNLRR